MKVIRDLFTGTDNSHWELGRVMSAWAIASYSGAFITGVVRGSTIDWSALGVGYAAVLAGSGALIAAKDIAKAKSGGGDVSS